LKIFHSISSFKATNPTIVTIGTFDGVHLGHRKILELITKSAKETSSESLVLTFSPHPRIIVHEDTEMKQLNSLNEKKELLNNLGIDNLIIHPFDMAFSRLTAEEFVRDVLVSTFKIQKIIIGYDHRFGRNRTANINDLIAFGNRFGFDVDQISAEEINEVSISSTKIRNALAEGNVKLANSYLGQPYTLSGKVIKGNQLGRTIGFPTANIKIEENYKLIPSNGVYIVKSSVKGIIYCGMMNIGNRPTINGNAQSIEINLFDFDQNIYGETLTVIILHKMREEQKFESLEALKAQLVIDKKTAQEYFTLMP
jgi:riboflavin kinase/FMN adenylyltransferase